MNDAAQGARGKRRKLRIFLIAVAALLVLLIVPPLISIGRYKSRITEAISRSFGRPVRLSSVELRLLPWPGFVLTDLTVAEDPAYGAEPVLHANSVTANIRLLSLWRGRLEISSVSVDEASLNVVRAAPGKWNLDPLFRTAAKAGTAGGRAHRFPYLEATNSRINFKNGAEKLPFSLLDTDLSFWQESPGEWRVRLRGQPARTDVVLDLGDTGVVRMEASMHRAPELRLMPLRVDLDWRQAQLGQLSRLLIGYDPGWRGDLRGELHIEGTPEAATVTTQLQAAGVRRAEFIPAAPLDFDANCAFVYHYSQRALDNLACSSPLGDGRLQLSGDVPGVNTAPNLTLSLQRVPVAAGLDMLRTLRSGIDPDLEAGGTISGKLAYSRKQSAPQRVHLRRGRAPVAAQGPLTGSLTVEGFSLSGGSLLQPLRAAKVILEPAPHSLASSPASPDGEALVGTAPIAAGGAAPLAVSVKLALAGYDVGLHGAISIARARELAQAAGVPNANLLDGLAGEPLTANLTAEGPWLPSSAAAPAGPGAAPVALVPAPALPPANLPAAGASAADSLSGTLALHNANWRADYLANHVQISEATLHLNGSELRFDPLAFSYGPVKGTATITVPLDCPPAQPGAAPCRPQFTAQFGALEAGTLEAAFLGARQKGTLFSDLIARFQSQSAPLWPAVEGTVNAGSFAIGPLTLAKASATVKVADDRAEIEDIAGSALGGTVKASATVQWSAEGGPAYTVSAEFDRLNAAAAGKLLSARWSGGPVSLGGKIELSGFTGEQLAASAKGSLHFDWKNGAMGAAAAAAKKKAPASSAMPAHFADWSGDAAIANGRIVLNQNQLAAGARNYTIDGGVTLGNPPKLRFEAKSGPAAKPR